jgi:DNA-binding NarL/FixJ family response regulator
VRVVLVEPNRLVRQGIRAELAQGGAEIVADVATAKDALAAAEEHRPDVVVLDLELPDAPGVDICATLASEHPSMRIVVLADPGDKASVNLAIDRGARAYLLKDADDLDLLDAIRRVVSGESVIDPRAAAALIDARRGTDEPKLSTQELNVLRLVADGLTNPQIGARLFLSRHTVKEYLSHAMRKLEAANRIEAVRKATELGLIEGAGGPQLKPEAVAYDASLAPKNTSELKVTPLKIEQLLKTRPRRQSR